MRLKAIELARSTLVVQDARRFMALGAIEGYRTHPFDLGGTGSSWPWAIEFSLSTRVELNTMRFMVFNAIEGNRTCPFDSCGTESQVIYGLGSDRRQSKSPVRLLWHRMPGAS